MVSSLLKLIIIISIWPTGDSGEADMVEHYPSHLPVELTTVDDCTLIVSLGCYTKLSVCLHTYHLDLVQFMRGWLSSWRDRRIFLTLQIHLTAFSFYDIWIE